MSEDFGQFACDLADEEARAFRARKSKSKIMPDLSKCQVFSLANLMEANQKLSIPEKKPGNFQMPVVNPKPVVNPSKPLPTVSRQTTLPLKQPPAMPAAPSKNVESIFGSDPRAKAVQPSEPILP